MLFPLFAALLCPTAQAQDTVDIGVIRDSEVQVVQRLLYPKAGRTERGVHLGLMAFDPFLVTPNVALSYDSHRSETLSYGVIVGGGWGLKNAAYRELSSPTYGIAPDAYRYLASALGGASWTPVYAKAALSGSKVVHFDLYATGRGGITLEQSVIPSGGLAVAPTVSGGVGARVFLDEGAVLRLELRDDAMVEHRSLTDTTHLKQNVNLTVGYTLLSPRRDR
ncbi:MAG: outer membrane beta-barrel domain-containing protein [Deltaproteobacteria bacterium]|nr:outer membrane beta-barrel domain-containing protein [Deltaproteobacteria bacterium]